MKNIVRVDGEYYRVPTEVKELIEAQSDLQLELAGMCKEMIAELECNTDEESLYSIKLPKWEARLKEIGAYDDECIERK